MNSVKQAFRFTLLAAALLLALLSCQNTLSGGTELSPRIDPNFGKLDISFPNNWLSMSTILPGIDVSIQDYVVTLTTTEQGVTPPAPVTGSSTSVSFYPLAPGVWSVSVVARNAAGDTIGIGQATDVLVEGGKSTPLDITVEPEAGSGTLDLSFTWPAVVADELKVYLGPYGASKAESDELLLTITQDEDSTVAVYQGTREAGSYDLIIELLDNGAPVIGYFPHRVAVWIMQDRTSTGNYSTEEGALEINIGSDLTVYDISFAWAPEAPTDQDQITVSLDLVPVDPIPDEVRWYLNGVQQQDGSLEELVLGSLDAGRYWLDAVVRSGSRLSSHGAPFQVQ